MSRGSSRVSNVTPTLQSTSINSLHLTDDEEKMLCELKCYHGYILSQNLGHLLTETGFYLVRCVECRNKESTGFYRKMELCVVCSKAVEPSLSCTTAKASGQPPEQVNVVSYNDIHRSGQKYHLSNGPQFSSISKLLSHYKEHDYNTEQECWSLVQEVVVCNCELCPKKSDISLGEILSSGYFSVIRKATILKTDKLVIAVEAKNQPGRAMQLLNEASLRMSLKHENVVGMISAITYERPVCMLLKYHKGHQLDFYIRKFKLSLSEKQKLATDVAEAIKYIHFMLRIVVEVQSKNCLFDGNKVKLYSMPFITLGERAGLPKRTELKVRWLAPETLKDYKISTKSDVYSYGVLLYELMSNGANPYAGFNTGTVVDMIKQGKKLSFPNDTPKRLSIYVSLHLWNMESSLRPSMKAVVDSLASLFVLCE